MRLRSSDIRRIEELADRILTMRIGEGDPLPALVPALAALIERMLQRCSLHGAALVAALEWMVTPAWLVTPQRAIAYANSAGVALCDRDRERVTHGIREAVTGTSLDFDAVPVVVQGSREHHLVRLRSRSQDTAERVARAGRTWRLTRRQGEVLAQLARGLSNKEIAAAVGCAGATVELHVSALLRRSKSDSRARLVARFWSEL